MRAMKLEQFSKVGPDLIIVRLTTPWSAAKVQESQAALRWWNIRSGTEHMTRDDFIGYVGDPAFMAQH
jgi:hypothetical protein